MGTGMDLGSTSKTRAQHRVEKRQAVLLVALVLVIAVVSFVLGVTVGRHGREPGVVLQVSQPQRITPAENLVAPAEPAPAVEALAEERLSFYDNLSKDETAPLGSGINLPPATSKAAQRAGGEAVVPLKGTLPVIRPGAAAGAPAVAADSAKGMPPVAKGGEWAVQVFSSQSAADAGMLRDELGGKGYPAFIAEADLGSRGIWYRVFVGPYADKAAAAQAETYALKKDKITGFAKRR